MIRKIFLYVAAAVFGVCSAVAVTAVFMIVQVTDESMEPEIIIGSNVLVNKIDRSVKVGDLIAFENNVYGENGEGHILIRRVAAVSGDTVEIKDNMFYLNDKPYTDFMSQAAHMKPYAKRTLSEGQIFVLCDDRRLAMDSRDDAVGVLEADECCGVVCFR